MQTTPGKPWKPGEAARENKMNSFTIFYVSSDKERRIRYAVDAEAMPGGAVVVGFAHNYHGQGLEEALHMMFGKEDEILAVRQAALDEWDEGDEWSDA